ncbi:MAG: Na+/H+ antiporter NhaA [Lautropia sp.]
MNQPAPTRLATAVDDAADHILGDPAAELTLVEYGSFACPYCHAAHEVVANLRDRFGPRLRYVFRHRPITGSPEALEAAVLVEYAALSGQDYWALHDRLMKRGPALQAAELPALAQSLGFAPRSIDVDGHGHDPHSDFGSDSGWQRAEARVQRDRDSARASGAQMSPTFFINDRRYEGAWDESTLAEAMLGSPGHRVQSAALDFARWAPSTGLLLALMSLLAVAFANSPAGAAFEAFWQQPAGLSAGTSRFELPLRDWINDGLLSFFFLVVGLEIKRELTVGRLAGQRAAALPIFASLGGMIMPALIYLTLIPAGPLAAGWAVPTTTDTAFAIALIAVLGDRVPVALRVFLTAVVVVDDLVAIVVVALFYSGHLQLGWLAIAAAIGAALALLNRGGVYRALPYGVGGVLLWIALHASGLHATLAGVIVALVTPTRPPANLRALMAQAESVLSAEMRSARSGVLRHGPSEPALRALDAIHDRIESPADKLLRSVEPWSSYAILPLFALANAGVPIAASVIGTHHGLVAAIVAGLVGGKLIGIAGGAALAVAAGIASKPDEYGWRQLIGAAVLAGIGFTMSLYISAKAFPEPDDFAAAKIAVFMASLLAALLGAALLWRRDPAASAPAASSSAASPSAADPSAA